VPTEHLEFPVDGEGRRPADCADHDICAGHHNINTWEPPCGDEWDDGIDDFFQAGNQCGGEAPAPKARAPREDSQAVASRLDLRMLIPRP
jgi:hypothetical protein